MNIIFQCVALIVVFVGLVSCSKRKNLSDERVNAHFELLASGIRTIRTANENPVLDITKINKSIGLYKITDPWGCHYKIYALGDDDYIIRSSGKNKVMGGGDDYFCIFNLAAGGVSRELPTISGGSRD